MNCIKKELILIKVQSILGHEEKEDANQCDIIEINNKSDHKEEKKKGGQNYSDDQDKVKNYDTGEAIAIDIYFLSPTKLKESIW